MSSSGLWVYILVHMYMCHLQTLHTYPLKKNQNKILAVKFLWLSLLQLPLHIAATNFEWAPSVTVTRIVSHINSPTPEAQQTFLWYMVSLARTERHLE